MRQPLPSSHALCAILPLTLLAPIGAAQSFVLNTADTPVSAGGNFSDSENVDFGDVDNDGDWDAVFADGGDSSLDQNRLWINQGPGAGLGTFQDQTITQLPSVNDQSRDVEFVDFDGDSDLDLYIANHSSFVAQPCRWWQNTGGGFYVDETSARWINIAGSGSSIAPSQLLGEGGFIDFSGDGDFADLDNDGDMDLFHSSYGGAYDGRTPSRVFLNDGAGFFSEFNPSGFQLAGEEILAGGPGLWCEGSQQHNTTNSSGAQCDIASDAIDIDLGDIDGDFDVDILLGSRSNLPRLFVNREAENGGVLAFRDVTNSHFPSGHAVGGGNYEQEMGDLDGDGDLDILGVNWFGWTDALLLNSGSGHFDHHMTLPGSQDDDEEADFIDYDNDGDLDIYVANFSGVDRLYRNTGAPAYDFKLKPLPEGTSATSRDVDVCDVDGDGDYDAFTASKALTTTGEGPNLYVENVTGTPDTHGPYIPNLEQAPNREPGSEPTVIRAQVYDNAPYYITWYNETTLNYTVDGGPTSAVPMTSSGGQIFRGELPGMLNGHIMYWVSSEDEYGNQGSSSPRSFNSTSGGTTGLAFCLGDGSGNPCPCLNQGGAGEGCANGTGSGGLLSGTGSSSVSAGDLKLWGSRLAPSTPGVYFEGVALVGGALGVNFGDGLRCAGGQLIRIQPRIADGGGNSNTNVNIPQKTAVSAGETRYYQLMYRDVAGTPCGTGFNVTQALEITWTP